MYKTSIEHCTYGMQVVTEINSLVDACKSRGYEVKGVGLPDKCITLLRADYESNKLLHVTYDGPTVKTFLSDLELFPFSNRCEHVIFPILDL